MHTLWLFDLVSNFIIGKEGAFVFSQSKEIQRDDVGSIGEEAPPTFSSRYEISSPGSNWFWSPQNCPDAYRFGCACYKGLIPGNVINSFKLLLCISFFLEDFSCLFRKNF